MNYEQARYNMVEQQIRTWDVLDQRVLDAMSELRRDAFVPKEYRSLAYADTRIPLPEGQVMMTPKVEARICQELRLQPDERAYEIGTGSGFLTALLARLTRHVYSIEINERLARTAAKTLAEQGVENITLRMGDGLQGWPEHGPFDAVAVTGSIPEMDERMLRWITPGGRLFVVVGEPPIMEARVYTRHGHQDWTWESPFDTELPPLLGLPEKEAFVF